MASKVVNAHGEEVNRLTPTKDTLRELYLKSGNVCAFPECKHVIIDTEGRYIGELCHIEAAEAGGQRFNVNKSNEDNRQFSNLMLMCHQHHVFTNDVTKYTVDILRAMKANHEGKFTGILEKLEKEITDRSATIQPSVCESLDALNEILGWGLEKQELSVTLGEMKWLIERVHQLPERTRQLLSIVVSRLERKTLPVTGRYDYSRSVLADEISEACDIGASEIVKHLGIIERYDLGYLDNYDDTEPAQIRLSAASSGWFILGDIREYCDRTGIPRDAILVKLQFNLLD